MDLWIKSRDDIDKALAPITDQALTDARRTLRQSPHDRIIQIMNDIRPRAVRLGLNVFGTAAAWQEFFVRLGACAYDFAMTYGLDTDAFFALLLKKHAAYGSKPLRRWREFGVLVRIDSKVARMEQLMETEITRVEDITKAMSESITDTVLDILGYCIIGWHMTNDGAFQAERFASPFGG